MLKILISKLLQHSAISSLKLHITCFLTVSALFHDLEFSTYYNLALRAHLSHEIFLSFYFFLCFHSNSQALFICLTLQLLPRGNNSEAILHVWHLERDYTVVFHRIEYGLGFQTRNLLFPLLLKEILNYSSPNEGKFRSHFASFTRGQKS